MVVGENKRSNIMDGIENTGDVRLHDHRLRLKQRFDIVRKLGQGTYGKVQLGINKKTGQEVAIKTIKKCKIESEADLVRIRREVQIMSSVRHPNIVHIYEVFENSEKMILVMEYCSGGELYDYLSQKKVLQEDEARRLFRQIATAVYYCHIHKICHRDLKLENVLLDDTGSAKIADFGLSNVFKETSLLSTFCGSPLYASPEIVKGTPYIGPEVDCWSLGVLLYTLVYGAMPFDGSNFKRLVRQISNGDYYEPKSPSTASPLIRDMLTVDAVKRADITYICDHSWVNAGYSTSCLEMAEALAAQTPVRLDLLLSLAPQARSNSNAVMVPAEPTELTEGESCTDLTSSASIMAVVEPSNSAEKRILELVAEGGEDAIKPSPTRTIVSAGENKRKLELAMSASGLQRKKERANSCASLGGQTPVPEEAVELPDDAEELPDDEASTPTPPPTLKSSATIVLQPSGASAPASPPPPAAPAPPAGVESKESTKQDKEEAKEKTGAKPRVSNASRTFNSVKKKVSPQTSEEKATPQKQEETAEEKEESKPNSVSSAADKLTSLSLTTQPSAPAPAPANQTVPKPKKFSMPGGNVGSFKDQFERRASLDRPAAVPADPKRSVSKPVVSKLSKPKAASEDRELSPRMIGGGGLGGVDTSSVRLQQIGVEPSPTPPSEKQPLNLRTGVLKTESEPSHAAPNDPAVLLQDARRSLQNSMAKLVEERAGEDSRRRAARDVISTAIRAGKPPTAYGRSSSAGVTSLSSLASPPAGPAPRVFRTEAQHRVDDHRNRGSVERIIPINLPSDDAPPSPAKAPPVAAPRNAPTPLRRLVSNESSTSEACSSPGEPIKKSAREFIIPIAVEGKGYVTPRQQSLEPETSSSRLARNTKPRRISLVSGGESEEEDDMHMHRLRSSRAARAESVSSGEEDEEDEGFHLLTAENLFSTLLHRVRALTNRLNGEEGPGFSQRPHSLFNNLQSPFFNSPHLPRRNLLREGWGTRDLHADFDSMFNKTRAPLPRGGSKKGKRRKGRADEEAEVAPEPGPEEELSEAELGALSLSAAEARALSGLTPALARRLRRRLLAELPASLPPRAACQLRRTLSLHEPRPVPSPASHGPPARSLSSSDTQPTEHTQPSTPTPQDTDQPTTVTPTELKDDMELPSPQFCTLPRSRRPISRDLTPSETDASRASHTPERPLLSKYLTPERSPAPLSEPLDCPSLLAEPSYIAAYGGPRHHSLRRHQPRKRVSRFLRSDFFDTPPDENLYEKHKKEKELETQKILKEIREKKNRSLDSGVKSPVDTDDSSFCQKDEFAYPRKCLSPISLLSLTGKERSRSNTPFYPILDNIKETTLDTALKSKDPIRYGNSEETKSKLEKDASLDSKLLRPKSYPVKSLVESFDEPSDSIETENTSSKESDSKEKSSTKESKLVRPKSYPTSSTSPEKAYVNRNSKKEEIQTPQKEESNVGRTDIEVSFNVKLPKKTKPTVLNKVDTFRKSKSLDHSDETKENSRKASDTILVLKKFQVVNGNDEGKSKDHKSENGSAIANGAVSKPEPAAEDTKYKIMNHTAKPEEVKLKSAEAEPAEKKGTIKKKIIRRVSSKSKTNANNNEEGADAKIVEKKKVTKKVKDKSIEDGTKPTVPKKKSVLQSIGHKFEKLTSNKSSSPEKAAEPDVTVNDSKKEPSKLSRTQREQSLPVGMEPPSEPSHIKRASTLTDVAALDTPHVTPSKTTVSKVLGLFRKCEPKEKVPKPIVEKSPSTLMEVTAESNSKSEPQPETTIDGEDKPKRPTSLLLNGIGRKNKYGRAASDGVAAVSVDNDHTGLKKENKNLRSSLRLDFSRLPRVKKVGPTSPGIEPQIMNVSDSKESHNKDASEKSEPITDSERKVKLSADSTDTLSNSRSRSRSTFSNSELKSDNSADIRAYDRRPLSPDTPHHPLRNHESTTPDKEDVVERIRRKSFYTRFNEKKHRRKSNLVGPGATEYDPLAKIHGTSTENKFDMSPTSPVAYDLSPGYSVASDLSPCTERYRTVLTDLPSARGNLRYDNYGLNDKIDTYRSLDRREFRKYPSTRSYLDYDQPSSYTSHRYSRTKSLLDGSDGDEDNGLGSLTSPHKYNRTISMYAPGSYATYRPKRTTLNSAIILKESEKEPSPENILEKIRQRKKFNISVTKKPDPEKDPLARSNVPSQGEGYRAECLEKVD